jgi:hypothetical protein
VKTKARRSFSRARLRKRARARIESNRIMHLIPRRSSILFARERESERERARERTLEIRDGGIVIRRATHGERATRDGATRARLRLDRPGMRARDARGGGFGHVVLYT